MLNWIATLLTLALSLNVYANDNEKLHPNNTYLARLDKHHNLNITGDGTVYVVKYDQAIYANGITYNKNTGHFILSESGTYLVTWSFPITSIYPSNTYGNAWVHAGGYDVPIYTGNLYAQRDLGGVPGGGSDIIAIVGMHIFKADVLVDPQVWVGIKIDGNSTRNIALLYDSFFSLQKIA